MYKQEDIVKYEDIPEDECDVCYLHGKAYPFFESLNPEKDDTEICPHCNSIMTNFAYGYDGKVIVGGHNGYEPDENIGYYKVYHCNECDKTYALMPQEITYNGNHDLFFTGGKRFLNKTDEEDLMNLVKEKMEPSVKQFVERVQNGEKGLGIWNLQYWLEDDLENALAEFLFEKGLKV